MKMNSIGYKMRLLGIILALSGCQSIPQPPEVEQAGYSVRFKKFRACNTATGNCRDIPRDDRSMEAAQCLSADDFKSMNAWIDQLIDALQRKKLQAVEIDE